MIDQLAEHEAAATAAIDGAESMQALAEAKTEVLGKNAPLTLAQRGLGSLPAEERKDAGKARYPGPG